MKSGSKGYLTSFGKNLFKKMNEKPLKVSELFSLTVEKPLMLKLYIFYCFQVKDHFFSYIITT